MVVIIVTIDDNYWMIPSSQAAFPLRGHPPGLRSQLAADGDESGHGGATALLRENPWEIPWKMEVFIGKSSINGWFSIAMQEKNLVILREKNDNSWISPAKPGEFPCFFPKKYG